MRTSQRTLTRLLLAAALAPVLGLAEPAVQPTTLQAQPVGKGAVLRVDLSRLPKQVDLRATAACVGKRITATGEPEEVRCQRPFTVDAPLVGDPVVLTFQPTGGGPPTRLEYPLTWDPRPRTFTVPAEGTVTRVTAPPPRAPLPSKAPTPMPADLLARVRAAAAATCGDCRGGFAFSLKDFAVEETPAPTATVVITIAPAP